MTLDPSRVRLGRRSIVATSLGATLALGGVRSRAFAQDREVRIGYQKGSAVLLILKSTGTLEERLGDFGYAVSWTEFPAALPLLEAMNAGSVNFGSTGAAPVIFAQAAGTDPVYALSTASSPKSQAIIVPADSPIETAADLAGKTVAAAKGSIALALLVRALESAGLQWGDAEPAYLLPADAKAAFTGGSIDAWSIWDPYYAAEEFASGARAVETNESLGMPNRGFYTADRRFAEEHGDALAVLAAALGETETWVGEHPEEVAETIAAEIGMDARVLLAAEQRKVYGTESISDDVLAGQQDLADMFFGLGLIPEPLDVSQATLPALSTLAS